MTTTSPDPQAAPPADANPAAQTPAASFVPPPAYTAPVIPTRRRTSLLTTVLLVAAAAIAVAGISFAAGRVTAPAAAATVNGRQFPGLGNGGPNGNGNGNGGTAGGGAFRGGFAGLGIRGTVTAVDGSTITVKLANGQEIKVQADSSTTYHQQTSGSASDVTNGKSVIVEVTPGAGGFGNGSTTGNVKASDITVAGQ
jgi:hypothetical protein